jgi:hypothetical protein
MEATRTRRLGSAFEWALAVMFFLIALGAGSIALREFHTVTAVMPVTPVSAHEPQTVAPAGVPSRAVSVPFLLLSDGRVVKVGDGVQLAAAAVGDQMRAGAETIERTPGGDERITRIYGDGDMQFVLVIEAARIAAIYVQ